MNEKRPEKNAWKKYGVYALTGLLLAGNIVSGPAAVASAKDEKRVTLNVAGDDNTTQTEASDDDTSGRTSLFIAPYTENQASDEETEEQTDAEETEPVSELTETAVPEDAAEEAETAEPEDAAEEAETAEPEEQTEAAETEMEATEKQESESTRVTLHTADDRNADGEDSAETETETETETEKETYAPIDLVETGASAIVATDVSGVVENFMPAMVSITNTVVEETDSAYYGTQEYESEGVASGIIIAQNEDELLIATNSHVVEDSTDIKVWFNVDAEREDDLCADGKIKGMDKNYELAVVAVRLEDIPEEILSQIRIATIGSSSSLKVGQTAIAISNQLGYGQSVTCGVISALNLDVELDSLKVPLLLMDTPINSGSSGGAVLDAQGCLIGIAVAKETGDGSESMSYAIPVDEAVPVLERLMNRETRDKLSDSERGYIGATVVNVNDDAKELYNMPEGAFVYEVSEGSAAEAAGIRRGDIITAFAGESVTSSSDLIDKISYYAAGETVVIELQTANDGKYETREVEVTLQAGTDVEDDDADADSSASEDDGSDQSQDGEEDWGEYGEIPGDSDDQEFGNLPYGFGSDEMY